MRVSQQDLLSKFINLDDVFGRKLKLFLSEQEIYLDKLYESGLQINYLIAQLSSEVEKKSCGIFVLLMKYCCVSEYTLKLSEDLKRIKDQSFFNFNRTNLS